MKIFGLLTAAALTTAFVQPAFAGDYHHDKENLAGRDRIRDAVVHLSEAVELLTITCERWKELEHTRITVVLGDAVFDLSSIAFELYSIVEFGRHDPLDGKIARLLESGQSNCPMHGGEPQPPPPPPLPQVPLPVDPSSD